MGNASSVVASAFCSTSLSKDDEKNIAPLQGPPTMYSSVSTRPSWMRPATGGVGAATRVAVSMCHAPGRWAPGSA